MIVLDLFIIVLGLVLGSFLHTTAIRLQNGKSILKRSSCDHCSEPIDVMGLIPVFGYLFLTGKCRTCGGKIPPFYPLFEALNGFVLWLVFSKCGWSIDFVHFCLIFETLLLIALIDLRSQLIFPQPVVFGLLVQVVWLSVFGKHEILNALFGMFVGAGVFHWVSYLYQITRKKVGLGAGDATLLGLIGFVFGWKVLFPIIFWSAALGILGGGLMLVSRRESLTKEIAFGPWLVLSTFLVWRFAEFFQGFPLQIPDFNLLNF